MALDREAITIAARGGKSEWLSYPVGKLYGETLYTPLDECPLEVQENYTSNPVMARELIEAAGHVADADGIYFETTILVDSIGWEGTISLIIDQLDDVGILATMDVSEPGRFYTTMYSHEYPGIIAIGRGGTFLPDELDNYYFGHPWNPMMI